MCPIRKKAAVESCPALAICFSPPPSSSSLLLFVFFFVLSLHSLLQPHAAHSWVQVATVAVTDYSVLGPTNTLIETVLEISTNFIVQPTAGSPIINLDASSGIVLGSGSTLNPGMRRRVAHAPLGKVGKRFVRGVRLTQFGELGKGLKFQQPSVTQVLGWHCQFCLVLYCLG